MESNDKNIVIGNQNQKVFVCKVCGKEGQRKHLIHHIETHHTTGVSWTIYCDICGKMCKTKNILAAHKSQKHKISYYTTADLKYLDDKIKSMMESTEKIIFVGNKNRKVFVCNVCGKEGQRQHIIQHIETHHITGVSHACDICGKMCKTKYTLAAHKSQKHKQSAPVVNNLERQEEQENSEFGQLK